MHPTTLHQAWTSLPKCPAWLPPATQEPDACPAEPTAWTQAGFAPLSRPWLTRAWQWLSGSPSEEPIAASTTLRQRAQDGGARLLAAGEAAKASLRSHAAGRPFSQATSLAPWIQRLCDGKVEVLLADSDEYPALVEHALGEASPATHRFTPLPQRNAILVDTGRFSPGTKDTRGDLQSFLRAAAYQGDGAMRSLFRREAVTELRGLLRAAGGEADVDLLLDAAADLAVNDPPSLPLAQGIRQLLGADARRVALAALLDGEAQAMRHLVTAGLVLHANERARGLLAPVIGEFDLLQRGLHLEMDAEPAARPAVFWAMDPASALRGHTAARRYLRPKDRVATRQGLAPARERCTVQVAFSRKSPPSENSFLVTMLRAYQGSFRNHVMDMISRSRSGGSEQLAANSAVPYLLRKSGQQPDAGAPSAAADALEQEIARRAASDGVHFEEAERRVLSVLYDPRRTGTPEDIAELAQLQAQLQRPGEPLHGEPRPGADTLVPVRLSPHVLNQLQRVLLLGGNRAGIEAYVERLVNAANQVIAGQRPMSREAKDELKRTMDDLSSPVEVPQPDKGPATASEPAWTRLVHGAAQATREIRGKVKEIEGLIAGDPPPPSPDPSRNGLSEAEIQRLREHIRNA